MLNVKVVPVSGSGVRPSLFSGSVEQSRSFHPSFSGGAWMGAPDVVNKEAGINTESGPNWTLPLVVAGGAVVVALLVSVLAGRK